MSEPDTPHLVHQQVRSSETPKGVFKRTWPRLAGLLVIELALAGLLGLLVWQAAPAYALPGSFEAGLPGDIPAPSAVQSIQTQVNSAESRSTPALQGTSPLTLSILSSPSAVVDSNKPATGPRAFVVEAVITNTSLTTATGVVATLNYDPDPVTGWVLLAGEEVEREIGSLAPGQAAYAYWFASYPITTTLTHIYTVTVTADGASPIAESRNFYLPGSNWTVQTQGANSGGSTRLLQSVTDIEVGLAFTATVKWGLGGNVQKLVISPAGNFNFDAGSYRLTAARVTFIDESVVPPITGTAIHDRLYFPSLPQTPAFTPTHALGEFTFFALRPSVASLCPYAAPFRGGGYKYDNGFCNPIIPITGTLTVSMTKEASSPTVEQGQLLTYTIRYTNTSDKSLQETWIWDEFSNLASAVTGSINPPPTVLTDSLVAWKLGTLPPTSTGTVDFAVVVDGDGQQVEDDTPLVNRAYFGVSLVGLPHVAAFSTTVTSTILAPELALSKTDGATVARPGDLLTYTLRITNSGSTATGQLDMADLLPDGVTPAGPTSPLTDTQTGQSLLWTSQVVPADDSLLVSIPVKVNLDVPDGTALLNTAAITYQSAGGYVYPTLIATDTTLVNAPAVTITKTATDVDGGDVKVGDSIRYTLQVANNGHDTANDLVISDDLPDQVTCTGVSENGSPAGCADPVIWQIPSLATGTTASLVITVTINDGAEGQSIPNTGTVSGSNVPETTTDPPVCPDGSPAVGGVCLNTPLPADTNLALTKTGQDLNGPPLVVGDPIRYTLLVTNTGPYTAYGVVVNDNLPDQVTYFDSSASMGSVTGTDLITWSVGTLSVDQSASLLITSTINDGTEGQTITNTGSVTGTNALPPVDPPPVCPDGSAPPCDDDNSRPVHKTSLTFTKTATDTDGLPLLVGDAIRYTLQVTNTGLYTAYGVVITDDLPNQVTCTAVSGNSAPPGCADPLVWSIPSLPTSTTASLFITATVKSGTAGQTITNTGTITGANVFPVDPPQPVCPDGSNPDELGVCAVTPEGGPGGIFLPIILKNSTS